jgi:predicted transcriptional regulator
MAEDTKQQQLSRRERQIMDIVYRHGRVTAAEVMDQLPDPPSYSAVRAMLRLLEEKGVLKHEEDGPRYVFMPVVGRDKARRLELKRMLRTFFEGSTEQVVAALLEGADTKLSDTELDRLSQLIDQAKQEETEP